MTYILLSAKNKFMRLKLKPNNIHMQTIYVCTAKLKLKKIKLDNFELKFLLGPFKLY